MQRKIH